MNTWTLERKSVSAKTSAQEESLFSLGNGYIGWRGNYEEGCARVPEIQGCYLNGFHETEKIRYGEIAYGYAEESQTMLNVQSSQQILLCADGLALHPEDAEETVRTLHMDEGLSTRRTVYRIPGGRLTVTCERLVSFAHSHCAAIRMTLCADVPCGVEATALLSGKVTNLACVDDPRVGSGLRGVVLSAPQMGEEGGAEGIAQHTKNTRLCCACAMRCSVSDGEAPKTEKDEYAIRQSWKLALEPGRPVSLEKVVAYFSGEEGEEETLLCKALREAAKASELGFSALRAEQAAYMADFWERCDIEIDGDELLQQGLHFNMFHLLQSTGRDGKTNVAAKGLTGEGYEGHYFWDTETYIFPMFLHTAPEIARQLLAYRYSILPCARERAREMGHDVGALFPWRTINGRCASAYYPAGTAQVHIDADVALAVKRYWEATGDDEFLWEMGAEIVCETARLYLDLGFYNPRKEGRFCINGVTGPDEYNAIVDNNAYTNIMAAVNMRFAADVLSDMANRSPAHYARLAEKIGLGDGEAEEWRRAADAMYIPRDQESGLVWQDDGFMDRVPWPLSSIPKENRPLLLHYHPLVIYRHQVCKQADTVLAMLLLPDLFTKEEKAAAFDFYDSVTTHDSSLSMAAFGAVAAQCGRMDKAYRYFMETARLDLDDTHGNTRDGLHMANMAGTWVGMVSGFGGMRVTREGVSFSPVLPAEMKGYCFRVMVRGRLISVKVSREGASYALLRGEPLEIMADGKALYLEDNKEKRA